MPADGAALIDRLKTETIRWPLENYRAALAGLDPALVADLDSQWGTPESDPAIDNGDFVFKAVRCGHALIACSRIAAGAPIAPQNIMIPGDRRGTAMSRFICGCAHVDNATR